MYRAFFKRQFMNIVLYGVSADIAEKIAGRCDLKVINTVEEIDGMGSVLLVPPKRDLRQLLAFYNAMASGKTRSTRSSSAGSNPARRSARCSIARPRESSSRRAVIRSPGSGSGIVPACRCPLCGLDQSRTLFFPHLGRMSRNISKFIPGMGRPSTETYSSSKRFLTAALTEKSAQRTENSFSRVTSFIR